MLVAVLAEADAGRNRHLRFLKQVFGELDGAHLFCRRGNFRPNEHRALGLGNVPTGAIQSLDQRIAPLLIKRADFIDAILRPFEGLNRGDLNRLKDAVIEIALDARERVNHFPIANAKTDAPTRHVVAFRQGKKFHADIFRARGLKKARRFVAIES